MEGMVLSFVADHGLPFSSARNVELPKKMMRDPKTANKLPVERQTASYKMCDDLAKGREKQLIDKLKQGISVLISVKLQALTFTKCYYY